MPGLGPLMEFIAIADPVCFDYPPVAYNTSKAFTLCYILKLATALCPVQSAKQIDFELEHPRWNNRLDSLMYRHASSDLRCNRASGNVLVRECPVVE